MLVIVGNTFFMAGVVYLPLNIGRLLLNAARRACSMMTLEQQQMLQQLVTQHVQIPYVAEFIQFILSILVPLAAAGEDAFSALAGNATAAANATAGVGFAGFNASVSTASSATNITVAALEAANTTAAAAPAVDATELPSLGAMPISFDHVMKEIHAQLELPARADFVALSLGHCCLGTVLLLVLWLYMSVRLWRAARRRMRRTGRRPLLQVGSMVFEHNLCGSTCLRAMLLLWLYISMRLWRAARSWMRRTGRRPLLQVGVVEF